MPLFPRFFGQIMQTQEKIKLVTGQEIKVPEGFTPGEVRAMKKWSNQFAKGIADFLGVPVEQIRVPPSAPTEFIKGYRRAFLVPRSPTPSQAQKMAQTHAKHFTQTVKNSGG